MKTKKTSYLVVNFGGPRNLEEIYPFLQALLTDREVIRSRLPDLVYRPLFSWIAKRRSRKVVHEYQAMGGCSPIYADTEAVADRLRGHLQKPLLTFHRYIPATHEAFKKALIADESDEIRVFPLFPQFSYATTGSVAKWFEQELPAKVVQKLRWIKSYAAHPAFVQVHQEIIRAYLKEHQLKEEETILLFSAHGLPQTFVDGGDIYQSECEASFKHIMEAFPSVLGCLSYQSKFGRGEWLRPYTIDKCQEILSWNQGKKHVVFIPISFTSDHIETLCEIENDYMRVVREKGLEAYRIPALNRKEVWYQAMFEILRERNFCSNQMLVRAK